MLVVTSLSALAQVCNHVYELKSSFIIACIFLRVTLNVPCAGSQHERFSSVLISARRWTMARVRALLFMIWYDVCKTAWILYCLFWHPSNSMMAWLFPRLHHIPCAHDLHNDHVQQSIASSWQLRPVPRFVGTFSILRFYIFLIWLVSGVSAAGWWPLPRVWRLSPETSGQYCHITQ